MPGEREIRRAARDSILTRRHRHCRHGLVTSRVKKVMPICWWRVALTMVTTKALATGRLVTAGQTSARTGEPPPIARDTSRVLHRVPVRAASRQMIVPQGAGTLSPETRAEVRMPYRAAATRREASWQCSPEIHTTAHAVVREGGENPNAESRTKTSRSPHGYYPSRRQGQSAPRCSVSRAACTRTSTGGPSAGSSARPASDIMVRKGHERFHASED